MTITYSRVLALSLGLILFCAVKLAAQEDIQFHKYAIGFSPSAFANIYSGIQISNDVAILPKLNATIETGYLFRQAGLTGGELAGGTLPIQGYRIKAGLQYMMYSSENIGLTFGMNYLQRSQTLEYFREESNILILQEPSYSMRKTRSTLRGIELNTSIIWKLTDRLRIEFGGGFGWGRNTNKDIENISIPRNDEDFFFLIPPVLIDSQLPIFSFNANVSYALIQ